MTQRHPNAQLRQTIRRQIAVTYTAQFFGCFCTALGLYTLLDIALTPPANVIDDTWPSHAFYLVMSMLTAVLCGFAGWRMYTLNHRTRNALRDLLKRQNRLYFRDPDQ